MINRAAIVGRQASFSVWNLARWSLLTLTMVLSIGCSSNGGTGINGTDYSDANDLMAFSSITTEYPGSSILRETLNYGYDSMGRLVSMAPDLVTMGLQQSDFTTELQYENGLLVSVDGPDESVNYTVEMGRIVSRTSTNKRSGEVITTRYTYDESARLVHVTEDAMPFARGCLSGPGDRDGGYSITWEGDRVVGIVSDAGDLSVGYGYNDAGMLVSRSIRHDCVDPEAVERYSYDEAGRLVTIERDPGSARARRTEVHSYNDYGQLIGTAITNGEGVKVEQRNYVYNVNGTLESITTLFNGRVAGIISFEYTSSVCAEQLWIEPESAIMPETETRYFRGPGMPKCAYFPLLR